MRPLVRVRAGSCGFGGFDGIGGGGEKVQGISPQKSKKTPVRWSREADAILVEVKAAHPTLGWQDLEKIMRERGVDKVSTSLRHLFAFSSLSPSSSLLSISSLITSLIAVGEADTGEISQPPAARDQQGPVDLGGGHDFNYIPAGETEEE